MGVKSPTRFREAALPSIRGIRVIRGWLPLFSCPFVSIRG
jgi:hypothetical protein